MALRDSRILRALFYSMGGLLVLGFCLRVYLATTSNVGDGTYRGGRGLEVHYSSVAVLIVVVAALLIFSGAALVFKRWRDRRDQSDGV